MKSIAFIIGSLGRGGAESVVSILSTDYLKRGWKVSIVMLLHNLVEQDLDPAIEIVNLSNDQKNNLFGLPERLRALRKFLKTKKPDVAVSFMGPNTMMTSLAIKGLPIRFIPSERIDPAMVNRNFIYKKLLYRAYATCDKFVVQTKRAMNYFPQKIQKNAVVIGNPIRVKAMATEEKTKRIVTAGRLTSQKNHVMLIDAFAELHKAHPEYKLEIYGDGDLKSSLLAHAKDKGVSDAVELMGARKDLHTCISDAEIFVLSSDYEGLSNALLEAMMMGLPCISTDCAGSDEVIVDGENGLLVPVGNTQKLAEAMLKLAEDHALRANISKAGKTSTEQYKVENIIKQWNDVIEEGVE